MSPLPLVITGSIVPQSCFRRIADWQERRTQYIQGLRYFATRYPVYFLENSSYDWSQDANFKMANLTLVKLRDDDPEGFELGQGYKEFPRQHLHHLSSVQPQENRRNHCWLEPC